MKFYIVYKTTNQINSKFYIGMHQTEDLNDGYLGSGVILKKAIKKYGRSSFKREIIANCISHNVARSIEKQLVKYSIQTSGRMCYNRAFGGSGAVLGEGNAFYGKEHSEETKRLLSERASRRVGDKNHFYGKKHTDETKAKIRSNRPNRASSENFRKYFWRHTKFWYCTPLGCFYSSRAASEYTGYGRNSIKSWCGNQDKYVNPNYQIPQEFWGRTWKENGFYIVDKTINTE